MTKPDGAIDYYGLGSQGFMLVTVGEGGDFRTQGIALKRTEVVFMGPESVLKRDTVKNKPL